MSFRKHFSSFFFLTNLTSYFVLLTQAVQTAHVAEEWVDHAHSKLKDKKACWVLTMKNLAVAEKKNKDLTLKLTKVERERKSAEASLVEVEKQAEE